MVAEEDLLDYGIQILCILLENKIRHLLNQIKSKNTKKRKKCWVKQWVAKRNHLSLSQTFLQEVKSEDPETFRNHLRMSVDKFEELFCLVEPDISKRDTRLREAIPARMKLELVLRYLAAGESLTSLAHSYRIPKSTSSKFLIPVLKSICRHLSCYIKIPNSEEEWRQIAYGFSTRANFPECCGALDGKHIRIRCPPFSNSDFYNYKGYFSQVLFALVDSNYKFIYIDVGRNGRINDSSVFRDCSLKSSIENGSLNFPEWGVIVGDDAFPLLPYLMKPYSHHGTLTREEIIFNYRLSRARRIVENAFGILTSRFRIFTRAIDLAPEKVDEIVKACCCLHNWLRSTSPNYLPPGSVDYEDVDTGEMRPGQWRKEVSEPQVLNSIKQSSARNYSRCAFRVREKYKEYFMNSGAVDWQWRFI